MPDFLLFKYLRGIISTNLLHISLYSFNFKNYLTLLIKECIIKNNINFYEKGSIEILYGQSTYSIYDYIY